MNNYFASFYSQVLLSLLKKVEKTFIFTQKWLDLRGSGNYATFPPPPLRSPCTSVGEKSIHASALKLLGFIVDGLWLIHGTSDI